MVASNLKKRDVDRIIIRGIEKQRRAMILHWLDDFCDKMASEEAGANGGEMLMLAVNAQASLLEGNPVVALEAIILLIESLRENPCG